MSKISPDNKNCLHKNYFHFSIEVIVEETLIVAAEVNVLFIIAVAVVYKSDLGSGGGIRWEL